ncbi:MAG: dephospho-CoA kinase [Nitrospinaceae bacterium]
MKRWIEGNANLSWMEDIRVALRVGLTGGMGSGKTLAASFFKERGAHVIDADAICRDLVRPHQPAWEEIVHHFGRDILNPDQSLHRTKLAEVVFHDEKKRALLEKILHPRVFEVEEKLFQSICAKEPHALIVVDAALLIESGNYRQMDKVLVVTSDRENQVRRVMRRNSLSREQVLARLESQMSLEEKIKKADYVLENNSTIQSLRTKVESLFRELKSFA